MKNLIMYQEAAVGVLNAQNADVLKLNLSIYGIRNKNITGRPLYVQIVKNLYVGVSRNIL